MIPDDIRKWLPHRPPFLLVDKISAREPGKWVKGYKNVSWSDWFIDQEVPEPCVSTMLVVEAIAQLSSFVCLEPIEGLGLLASLGSVRSERQAVVGDRLDLHFELLREKAGFWVGRGEASVERELVVVAEEIVILVGKHGKRV